MAVKGKNSLFFDSGIDLTGLATGARGAQGIIQGLATTVSKINPFAALAVGAITAFGIVANRARQFAQDYEQAMKEVETISKATQADFAGISGKIFDLSKIVVDDPIKLAKAYYQIVSAGYDGVEALNLLEVASKAAVAGVTDTQTAADGITTVLNAFKLSASDADKVADAMFKTVELGKTTFEQLSAKMSVAAPLASALGVGYNEILAATASLTKQGVPTAQAMTQIRSAIDGANRSLGDGWANAYTFQDAMQLLYKQAGGSASKLQKMVGSIEAVSAVLSLSGKNAESAAQDYLSLINASGSATTAFERMASSGQNQYAILRNNIRAMTEELGVYTLAISNDLLTGLNRWIRDENAVSKSMTESATKLRILSREILNEQTPKKERIRLVKEAQALAPTTLKDIKAETITYDALAKALALANEELKTQIRLQRVKEDIIVEEEKKQDILERQVTTEDQLDAIADKLLEKYKDQNIELDKSLTKFEGYQKLYNETAELTKNDVFKGVLTDVGSFGKALNNWKIQNSLIDGAQKKIDKLNQTGLKIDAKFVSDDGDIETVLKEQLDIIARASNVTQIESQLNSTNKIIKDAAVARKEYLENLFNPQGLETDAEKFDKYISGMKAKYESYEIEKEQLGKEVAVKNNSALLQEGHSFRDFLNNKLKTEQEYYKLASIARAAASVDYSLAKDDGKLLEKLPTFKAPVKLDIEIDTESLGYIEAQLAKLREQFAKGGTDSRKKELARQIQDLERKRDIELQILEATEKGYQNLFDDIGDLGRKQLRQRLTDQKAVLKELLKNEEENKDKIKVVDNAISQTQEQIGENVQSSFQDIAATFDALAGLFDKLGNEEMSNLATQLSGIASAAGTIAKGDPVSVITGSIQALTAGITVDIVSDTSKFEESIKKLETAINKLDYAISQSVGDERIANREDAIDQLRELEQAAEDAEDAERKARKEVKFLGIGVGSKGEGSGTDPEKLIEFQEQAEEARRKVVELQDEINELFTGTTSSSIVDSILQGFEEGKKGAEDFSDTFEDLMRKAIIESLKLKYLEGAVEDFFKDFAEKAESDGGLSSGEINSLRNSFSTLIQQSEAELEALNSILGEAGISTGVTSQAQGLAGGIETVTEETANILAGTINKIMVDVNEGLDLHIQTNLLLSSIDARILELTEINENANILLQNIEKSLS